MSDQTRREADEDVWIGRLLQAAFLQVIIVVETGAQNFRRYGHGRQQPDSVQVDCRRLPEASADAQQVCALCDQLGKSAWESAVPLREAMPARAFIRGNSGGSTYFEIEDTHELPPCLIFLLFLKCSKIDISQNVKFLSDGPITRTGAIRMFMAIFSSLLFRQLSWPTATVILGDVAHFLRFELRGNGAHLLVDIILAHSLCKRGELALDVIRLLPLQRGCANFVAARPVTCRTGRDPTRGISVNN